MERKWLSVVLGVALVGVGIWGILQYQAKQRLGIQLENQYQRAFYDLNYNVDGLETLLAQTLVSNSRKKQMEFFSDIWRQATLAQYNLGQLPLTNLELSRTQNFIAKVSAASYFLFQKVGEGKEMEAKNWASLRGFARQAKFVKGQLQKMQPLFAGRPNWQAIERVTRTAAVIRSKEGTTEVARRPGEQGPLTSNPVTKSFMMLEDGLKRYPDPDFEGNTLNIKEKPTGITGAKLSRTQAPAAARRFLPIDKREELIRVTGTAAGPIPTYNLEVVPRRQERRMGKGAWRIQLALSQKGGHPLWMIMERSYNKPTLDMSRAEAKARAFLQGYGLRGMVAVGREIYDGVANFSFVRKIGDTYLYPEEIKMQVALDNGEIVGWEAMNYFTFHKSRSRPRFSLSEAQARARLNKNLRVERVRRVLIVNDVFKEVLAYEFKGTIGAEKYLVYINGANGDEEKIVREVPGQTEIL